MILKRALSVLIVMISITSVPRQVLAQADSVSVHMEQQEPDKGHSIGSSLFLLGNLAPGDPPYFFLLNYRYQIAQNHVMIVEAITWTYYEPLGTYGSSAKKYPGKIRAYGIGAGYQRFLWKNFYSTVQAIPFFQQFFDTENKRIQNGFQLYLQVRLGYHLELFNKRWFLEPSVALNYWPVNTNVPLSFQAVESGSPDYFLFEPGLHFGFKF